MKSLMVSLIASLFSLSLLAQDAVPAAPGVVYGKFKEGGEVVSVDELEKKIGDDKYEGKVKGKVVEVCQAMGCWARVQREDGSTVMIKVKNHEFAMPADLVGRIVVAEGEAKKKETSVSMLKHYAEDAGKSKEEIAKIKEPKMEVLMTIRGVQVVQ